MPRPGLVSAVDRIEEGVMNPGWDRPTHWSLGLDRKVGLPQDPWRRERLPTPVFWPGEFHGLYSPWVCKESEVGYNWATFTFTFKTRWGSRSERCWWRASNTLLRGLSLLEQIVSSHFTLCSERFSSLHGFEEEISQFCQSWPAHGQIRK